MKTVRLNHSNHSQLLPVINSSNDASISSSSANENVLNTSPSHYSSSNSKNGSPKSLNNFDTFKASTTSSTNGSPTKIVTSQQEQEQKQIDSNSASLNAPSETTAPNSSTTGLVRRLSVTARPGDIFYKVKDVTESCSTTDTITFDQNGNNDSQESPLLLNDEQDQEVTIQSSSSSTTNTNEIVETLDTNTISPKNLDQSGTLGRKTTTWNVRRNQSTNLGLTPPQLPLQQQHAQNITSSSDKIFKTKVSSRDDTSSDLINTTTSSNSNAINLAEPGSPNFTKELLSIR